MQKITKEEFLDKVKTGIRHFRGYSFSDLDLKDLRGLSDINFELCDFNLTKFNRSIMPNCKFIRCCFHYVGFNNTEISGTKFEYCHFFQASFFGMSMHRGAFNYCENLDFKLFKGADTSLAEIKETSCNQTHGDFLDNLIEEHT